MLKKFKTYLFFIILTLGVGALSAFITKDNMDIYSQINTPPLSPPGIVFPIVWSFLYTLMGISGAIIYIENKENKKDISSALYFFIFQLAVNFFWSIFFFNKRAYLFSFIWLILLIVLIVLMIREFLKINKTAAYLQIPYLIWVIFAGYLNLFIYILN